jgi:hypothetical protein
MEHPGSINKTDTLRYSVQACDLPILQSFGVRAGPISPTFMTNTSFTSS